MVDYVSDPAKLLRRLNRFAYSDGVEPELAEKLQTIPGVAADVITTAAELLYAYRDTLNERGLTVMGELFNYADQQGWTAFNRDGRSARIVQGVAFALGERKTEPAGVEPAPEVARRDGFDWRGPDADPAAPVPPAVSTASPAEPVGEGS